MALALKFDRQVSDGEVACYADIDRAGWVSRARVTQILDLTCLTPAIVEAMLHLPRVERGRDPVVFKDLLPIAHEPRWDVQRLMWDALLRDRGVELIAGEAISKPALPRRPELSPPSKGAYGRRVNENR